MPTVKSPKVFVSATSGDLRSVRVLIKDALLKIGCMPIEQSDFPPDYRTVSAFLTSEVEACDAVLHIVGNRYGAEPNPETLPPGTVRRSFTQLEYDVARRLKKKVFTFICADDFPYDACEPEPEIKKLLQAAHRATLAAGSEKYANVTSAEDCGDKVKLLRLQLEELTRQIATEHRRQIYAWSAVAGILSLIFVLGLVIWATMWGTRDQAKKIAEDTKRLAETTDKLRKTGDDVKKDVAKSLDVQKEATAKVSSIDTKVMQLVESDLLSAIALKSGIEPQQIKQLVLQSQATGLDTLSFARQLAKEGRHDVALGLSRFVAETALLLDNSDYRAAAEAFLIAAEERKNLLKSDDDNETGARYLNESAGLALRGLDAIRTLKPSEQALNESLYSDLALERAHSLWRAAALCEPGSAHGYVDKSLAQVEEAIARKPSDVHKLTALRRRRAWYLADKSHWTTIQTADRLLAEARGEADQTVELARLRGNAADQGWALRARVHVGMQSYDLQSQMAARATLQKVIQDCSDGRAILVDEQDERGKQVRAEFAALRGLAMLELAQRALSVAEKEKTFTDAVEQLTTTLAEAESQSNAHAGRIVSMGLLRAHSLQGDRRAAEPVLATANSYGFGGVEDRIALADYGVATNYLDTCHEAATLLRESIAKYTVSVSPRSYVKLNFALAKCLSAKSQIRRYTPENEEKFGFAEGDQREADQALQLVASKFPHDSSPRIWAQAQARLGRSMSRRAFNSDRERIKAYEAALTVFTREQDPVEWAELKQSLAIEIAASDPPRTAEALAAIDDALQVFDRQSFPYDFQSLCGHARHIHTELAKKATDKAIQRKEWSRALKFAVAVTESQRAENGKSGRHADELVKLVTEFKNSLPPEEREEVDVEVTRFTAEFKARDK